METDRISSTGVGATEPQQQGQQQQQGPQEQLEEQQEEEVWVAEDYICSKFPWPLADRDMTTIVTHRTLPGVAVRARATPCRTCAHRCLYICR